MKLKTIFQASIPKDESSGATNEDCCFIDEFNQRFVVCDGATESYDSGRWAKLLAKRWINDPRTLCRATTFNEVIRQYEVDSDLASMSWSKRGAYDRGSFTTLLGVIQKNNRANIVAIGDSLIVDSSTEGTERRFPYKSAEEFDQRPLLVSTNIFENKSASINSRKVLQVGTASWPLRRESVLLLMTDALGQWLLRRDANLYSRKILENINTFEDFRTFVETERSAGNMRRDDTTLIHLQTVDT